jgi:hypothetical protein
MKFAWIVAASLALLAGAVAWAEDADTEDAKPTVAQLDWLAGTWRGTANDGAEWETIYTPPTGGMVLSASKEMKGGRTVMYDFERFQQKGDDVVMVPYPFGKKSVEFTLTSYDADAKKAIFENPEHDFPRKFTYQRTADDKLSIALVGDMGGGDVEVTIDLTLVG